MIKISAPELLKVAELKWSRTVNTIGQKGPNISCNLHMEHLNRRLKLMMSNLGSYISKLQCIKNISVLFEQEAEIGIKHECDTLPSFH